MDAQTDHVIEDEKEEGLLSHLIELRKRLIYACSSVLIIFLLLVYWSSDIFRWLAHPLFVNLPAGGKMIVTDVTGSFFVPLKVTIVVSLLIALPFVLYQAWAFIAPGLYRHEKKWIFPLVSSSYLLFIVGMIFAYFVVFPTVFRVMAHYNAPLGVQMSTDIEHYVNFVLLMFLAFGLAFEVPVVVVLFVSLGFVSTTKLRQMRSYIIVGAFVLAAIVTPPDIFSQFSLALPLIILFEFGLWVARIVELRQQKHQRLSDNLTKF